MLVGTRNWYANSDLISHFLAMNYTSMHWGNESPSTPCYKFSFDNWDVFSLASFPPVFLSFMLSGDVLMQ